MEDKEWFLYVVDHHEGPYTIDEIKKLVKKGEAKNSSYVWKEGYEDWVMMSDLGEFGQKGAAKTDTHGTHSFIINDVKPDKPSSMAAAPEPTGPSIGDTRPSDSVWCLSSRKIFSGPHSMKTIIRKVNDGEASIKDQVWKEGWTTFVSISDIPDFMKDVKATAASHAEPVKIVAGDGAKALGMAGGPSTRVYKWYKSTRFLLVSIALLLVFVYQGVATGFFRPVLTQLKLQEKVDKLELAPMPFDKGIDLFLYGKAKALPLFERALLFAPENVRTWLSTIEVPEGVQPADAETIREIAVSSLKDGVKVASMLPSGDEFNPAFVIASNVPDGTSFTVILRGKEGTLLNAFTYERTAYVDINRSVGRTPRFAYENSKPLPKGEYQLIVYESDQQIPEAAAALSNIPKKAKVPKDIPPNKVAFVLDSYFLGGKRDANYQTRLKEFNDRVKTRLDTELGELKQLAATLESMANESATKFFAVAGQPATPRRKNDWMQYHGKYTRLGEQVSGALSKVSQANGNNSEYVLPQLYRKLLQTYELTERLHQAETAYIDKGGAMDPVKAQASQTAAALNELKQAIGRVTKPQ